VEAGDRGMRPGVHEAGDIGGSDILDGDDRADIVGSVIVAEGRVVDVLSVDM
jgi:hypothetical protein